MIKKALLGLFISASLWTAAQAQTVLIVDGGYAGSAVGLAAYLNTQGFTATASAGYPGSFAGYDAVIAVRTSNPGAALTSWVSAGGLLITEWTSTDWAAPLIGASISGGGFVGTSTPVTFTAAGLTAGLGANLTNPYSDVGATEFFRDFSSIGTGSVWATRGVNTPVIVEGAYFAGSVILMAHDWADTGFEGNAFTPTDPTAILIRNALRTAAPIGAVPEPSTYGLIGALALIGFVIRKRYVR